LYADVSEHCSILIGVLSRKNSQDGLLGYSYGKRFGWKSVFRRADGNCGGQSPLVKEDESARERGAMEWWR